MKIMKIECPHCHRHDYIFDRSYNEKYITCSKCGNLFFVKFQENEGGIDTSTLTEQKKSTVSYTKEENKKIPKFCVYIIAFLSCAIILVLYAIFCALAEWRRGGGFIEQAILWTVIFSVWKIITKKMNK